MFGKDEESCKIAMNIIFMQYLKSSSYCHYLFTIDKKIVFVKICLASKQMFLLLKFVSAGYSMKNRNT